MHFFLVSATALGQEVHPPSSARPWASAVYPWRRSSPLAPPGTPAPAPSKPEPDVFVRPRRARAVRHQRGPARPGAAVVNGALRARTERRGGGGWADRPRNTGLPVGRRP